MKNGELYKTRRGISAFLDLPLVHVKQGWDSLTINVQQSDKNGPAQLLIGSDSSQFSVWYITADAMAMLGEFFIEAAQEMRRGRGNR